MKTKVIVMAAMVTVLLAVGACSPAMGTPLPGEVKIEVTIDEFMATKHIAREVIVPDGGVLVIKLGSNPSTGFHWDETVKIPDSSVLQQTSNKLLVPEAKGIVGSPGSQVWTFKTLQKGKTTVSMGYSQPWVGGEKGIWTFELTVTVK